MPAAVENTWLAARPVVGPASAWNTMPLLAVTWPPPTFTAVTKLPGCVTEAGGGTDGVEVSTFKVPAGL